MIQILKVYFNIFRMRYRTPSYTTCWTRLEIGIAMGCTVSPILFVLAMQVILKAAEYEADTVCLGEGVNIPPLKAFMDDTTVMSNKAAKAQQVLDRLDTLISSCRMKFKPTKSRSLHSRRVRLMRK